MRVRADIAELLRAGVPQSHICRQLHVAPATVQRTREALGLPAPRSGPPETYASLEDAYRSNSVVVEGGHKRWTGPRNTKGHPLLNFRQRRSSVGRVAFLLHFGRVPEGRLTTGCDMAHCVEGAHLEDQRIRAANRRADDAFTSIFGEPA